ncbi:MAG: zf-TFIIB domain-containing protein [Planctomycetota bacterium]|nr:zf-TFIIB domain-containing protein [Planctomycetota bacterium]
MKCPICKTVALEEMEIEPGLGASHCSGCAGWWIDSARYWQWLEARPAEAAGGTEAININLAAQRPVRDSGPGKLCPACDRFMTHAKPGHGLNFFIDRCCHCGGTWLNANEWENLRDATLHDDIHLIASDTWQAEVTRAERAAHHEMLLAEKLGSAALAEIKRIKGWLDSHPKKAELYAFLIEPKGPTPLKR